MKKLCYSSFFDTLYIDCRARVKDVYIEVSLRCPEGYVKVSYRDISVEAKEPREAFFEPSIENPLPAKPIVARLRKELNRKKIDLSSFAADVLASVLILCENLESL